jgi:predicted enzyme related to lactoylglutathione lyase
VNGEAVAAIAPMPPGQNYTLLKAGETDVGGCMEPPMPGVPNHWHVYFAVDDADAMAAKAAAELRWFAIDRQGIWTPNEGRYARR